VSLLVQAAPALPLHKAGSYVAAAYIVFVALLLVYVTIMAIRLSRTERDLTELNRDLDARERTEHGDRNDDREQEPAAL
jgi:hypothetical protein